jgi:hypothetical protein
MTSSLRSLALAALLVLAGLVGAAERAVIVLDATGRPAPLASGDDYRLRDAANVAIGSTTGTKIGTATTQKIGFYNSTPVIQQTGDVATALSTLGLVASPTVVATTAVDGTFRILGSGDPTKMFAVEVDAQGAGFTTTLNTGAQTGSYSATLPVLPSSSIFAMSAAALTSGRVPVATTNGLLVDYSTFTTDGSTVLDFGADTDNTVTLGRMKIGDAASSDRAYFAHYDHFTSTNYGFVQLSTGTTNFNAPVGQTVNLAIGGTIVQTIAGSLITFAQPTTQATNWEQTGATTFSTGTGAISLNGAVTIVLGKTLTVADTTASSNPTSGCGIFAGGVGISGALNVAGNIGGGYFVTTATPGADGSLGKHATAGLTLRAVAGSSYDAALLTPGLSAYVWRVPTGTSRINFIDTTASTTTATGGATFAGGVGVAGAVYAGSFTTAATVTCESLTMTGVGTGTASFSILDNAASPFLVQQGSNEYLKVVTTNASERVFLGNATTNPLVSVLTTTAATTTTTGALTVAGGAGIAGAGYFGGTTLQVESATTGLLRIKNTDTTMSIGQVYGGLEWEGSDGSAGANGVRAKIEAIEVSGNGATDVVIYNTTLSSGTLSERIRAVYTGSLLLGAQVALATNATAGFIYVPTCAGTPTGVPTAYTGLAAAVVDTTNHKLYFYSGGAWRDAGP